MLSKLTKKVDKLEAVISQLVNEVRAVRADIEAIKEGQNVGAVQFAYTTTAAANECDSDENTDFCVSPKVHTKRRSIHDVTIMENEQNNVANRFPASNEQEFMQLNADCKIDEKLRQYIVSIGVFIFKVHNYNYFYIMLTKVNEYRKCADVIGMEKMIEQHLDWIFPVQKCKQIKWLQVKDGPIIQTLKGKLFIFLCFYFFLCLKNQFTESIALKMPNTKVMQRTLGIKKFFK